MVWSHLVMVQGSPTADAQPQEQETAGDTTTATGSPPDAQEATAQDRGSHSTRATAEAPEDHQRPPQHSQQDRTQTARDHQIPDIPELPSIFAQIAQKLSDVTRYQKIRFFQPDAI